MAFTSPRRRRQGQVVAVLHFVPPWPLLNAVTQNTHLVIRVIHHGSWHFITRTVCRSCFPRRSQPPGERPETADISSSDSTNSHWFCTEPFSWYSYQTQSNKETHSRGCPCLLFTINTNCYLGKHLGQPPPVDYKLDMWVYSEGLLLVLNCLKQVADPPVLFKAKHDGFIHHSSYGFLHSYSRWQQGSMGVNLGQFNTLLQTEISQNLLVELPWNSCTFIAPGEW